MGWGDKGGVGTEERWRGPLIITIFMAQIFWPIPWVASPKSREQ